MGFSLRLLLLSGLSLFLLLSLCPAVHSERVTDTDTERDTDNVVNKKTNKKTTRTSTAVDLRTQRKAIKAWSASLSAQDLDPTHWHSTLRHNPAHYFEHYLSRLSQTFEEVQGGALLNFVLVGACDGTHDATIQNHFLPSTHWRGVFVEPFEMNHADLVEFMRVNGAAERAFVLHAAATRRCAEETIKMKRPTFEEKNKSLPHWMRRQIGAVVPLDKLDRPATGGWTFEYTKCVNGPQILAEWASFLSKQSSHTGAQTVQRVRPHVLKVDVEGHDYEVLMGFLDEETPALELPLMISFEAKSIKKNIDALRAHLESRGYAVSQGDTNDGFALLKPEVFAKKRNKSRADSEDGSVSSDTQRDAVGETGRDPQPQRERLRGKRNVSNRGKGSASSKKKKSKTDDAMQ